MCGRYGFTIKDEKEFLNRFEIETINFELESNYNVAPTQVMPVIERHSPNSLYRRRWGVQPGWSKILLINAQAEKLTESKLWKKAFLESRCIIPANYFFEWKKTNNGKQPYLIKLKGGKSFGFAGLILSYLNEKKEEVTGFVIITTKPNQLMKEIHIRMPAILRKDDEDDWLNPDYSEPDRLLRMLTPYPSDDMELYQVSSLVNSPKNNYPEITRKFQAITA